MKTLVVDGDNLLVRVIKAAEGEVVLSHEGVWTAPMLMFIRGLAAQVKDESPDRVVICWDGGGSHFREEVFPEYKAARRIKRDPHVADQMRTQFEMVQELMAWAGVPQVRRAGVEADDLVATYVTRYQPSGPEDEVIILSGDKDFFQLLGDGVYQIRPGKVQYERWDAEKVRQVYGCGPEWVGLLLAIQGDAIDGVPGLKGIGPKKSLAMLEKSGWSREALLAGLAREDREIVERNCQLMMLPCPGIELDLPAIDGFAPVVPDGPATEGFLALIDRYALASIRAAFLSGHLWS